MRKEWPNFNIKSKLSSVRKKMKFKPEANRMSSSGNEKNKKSNLPLFDNLHISEGNNKTLKDKKMMKRLPN